MKQCDENDLNVLIPLDGLPSQVQSWTLSEHGNIEHRCGSGNNCRAGQGDWNKPLEMLASMGTIGDAMTKQTFLTSIHLKKRDNDGAFSYWATEAPFREEECRGVTEPLTTPCNPGGSNQKNTLYQL